MYTETQRRIFGPYWNGVAQVYADPIRVHRLLTHELDGDPNKYLTGAQAEDEPTRFQARNRLLAAATRALDMIPFSPETGQGALESDVMVALSNYLEFM